MKMCIAAWRRQLLGHASLVALASGLLAVAPASADNGNGNGNGDTDTYMAGDFHNHTTCTDGTVSIETMITKSIKTFNLEWMASADHGGTGTRDCRFDDPEFDSSRTGSGKLWEETIGAAAIKGDVVLSNLATPNPPATHRAMWRWQMIEEFTFPEVARLAKQLRNPMLYAGLESNVPGHEHLSMTVLGDQRAFNFRGDPGNASALAEFEYRWDRSDTDRSGKGGTPGVPESGIWKGKIPNASGPGLGTANHNNKAVPSVVWLQTNFPLDSYYVPAHVERAGVFDPNGNRGFNVEHFRDFNNAGPTVAVGFETMPGHQAANTRGEYQANFGGPGIDSVGVTTYGGTGIYGAKIGGLWDALLGEGRNWFFYASSDWHNRGIFSPFVRESTQDFFPSEYQRLWIPRPDRESRLRPQHIVDSVRAGNSFSVSGDLITGDFKFTAELEDGRSRGGDDDNRGRGNDHDGRNDDRREVRMGETLVVPRGSSVRITMTVTLPKDPNNSPYTFDNPSLLQIGIRQPLNRPVLDHVDFIRGNVSGVIAPTDPNYTNATNPSAAIIATFNSSNWKERGHKRTMTFVIRNIQGNQYVRARGTNLPPGTPFETDLQGNPLSDLPISKIPCTDPACPSHMQTDATGNKLSSFDVAAWADVWFYANPIFIRVSDQPKLRVEVNADMARRLASGR